MKLLHRDSYAFLTNRLTCKLLLQKLSKTFKVCWSFVIMVFVLIFFSIDFNLILILSVQYYFIPVCTISLPYDKTQLAPAETASRTNSTPVTDRSIKVVDELTMTTLSKRFKIDALVLKFFHVLPSTYDFYLWSK